MDLDGSSLNEGLNLLRGFQGTGYSQVIVRHKVEMMRVHDTNSCVNSHFQMKTHSSHTDLVLESE